MHVYLYVDDCPRNGKLWRSADDRLTFHALKLDNPDLDMADAPGYWGDVKGRGGYVLCPPSVHPSGVAYVPVNPGAPIVRVASLADVLPDPIKAPLPLPERPTLTAVPDTHDLYPESAVDRIRRTRSLTELVKPVQGRGRWLMAMCPFHQHTSNRPSLRLDTERGRAYCFSGCLTEQGVDVIGLYQRLRGVTFKEALAALG
jgi:hypothetical protein